MNSKEKLDSTIKGLIDKLITPVPIFKPDISKFRSNRDSIKFDLVGNSNCSLKEGVSLTRLEQALLELVNKHIRFSSGLNNFKIETSEIGREIESNVHSDIKTMWMEVNAKSNWRRTKISKKINPWSKYEQVLSIWLDAIEHGALQSDSTPENAKLRKFLAKQFENLAN